MSQSLPRLWDELLPLGLAEQAERVECGHDTRHGLGDERREPVERHLRRDLLRGRVNVIYRAQHQIELRFSRGRKRNRRFHRLNRPEYYRKQFQNQNQISQLFYTSFWLDCSGPKSSRRRGNAVKQCKETEE